jgi:Rieske Fe-S protein
MKTDKEGMKSVEDTGKQGDKEMTSPLLPSSPITRPDLDERRRKLIQWLWRIPVIAVLGGAAYGLYKAYVHLNRLPANPNPSFTPIDPVSIGDLNQFTQVWDSLEFSFATGPGILVQLPQPIAGGLSIGNQHFAAFTRICTHQGCIVSLNKNLEAIAVAFNYRTDEPTLTCQCHFSAFSLTDEGRAMSGPAVKPLPRIRLELRGQTLYATGLET